MITYQEARNHFYKYRHDYGLRWKLWFEWYIQENHGTTKPITVWKMVGQNCCSEFNHWEDGHVEGIIPQGNKSWLTKQWVKSFGYLCGIRVIT